MPVLVLEFQSSLKHTPELLRMVGIHLFIFVYFNLGQLQKKNIFSVLNILFLFKYGLSYRSKLKSSFIRKKGEEEMKESNGNRPMCFKYTCDLI